MTKDFINRNLPIEKSSAPIDFDSLLTLIIRQDRKAISKAFTLVENSNLSYDNKLLTFLGKLPKSEKSKRIAISGPPGVGKSTLIENMGMALINNGNRVAVLAIDPSSESGGGSILGDKTRMDKLSNEQNAFIRPSSNRLELGGIRKSTYDSIRICEAAGFDYIFVETVGVGQAEIDAWHITDLFILLTNPAAGDELQGIKRGIMEKADIIVINKSDGELLAASDIAFTQLKRTTKFLGVINRRSEPIILKTSALNDVGTDILIASIEKVNMENEKDGKKLEERKVKEIQWLKNQMHNMVYQMMLQNSSISKELKDIVEGIENKKFEFYNTLLTLNSVISSFTMNNENN